jgi:glucose/mannose-6-phosphate isomerase
MNLDDLELLQQIDSQDMLAEIDGLPEQLATAWQIGQQIGQGLPLPNNAVGISCVVISGMGGSAIGADLLAAYVADTCPVPVIVHRDYGLPAFAKGPETLVIASSHSGNTEETLDSFDHALKVGCTLLVVCTGGKLAQEAAKANIPVWKFDHSGQPRVAVGYSFGLLLALFSRLGLIPDQAAEIAGAVEAMREQQKNLVASIPAARNPAKRYAGQLVGRWVTVFGSGVLAPVARRWKTQINELAKAPANFEILPEADHNALAGLANPADLLQSRTLTMFLVAPSGHPRNRLRSEFTRQVFMLEGSNTDFYMAKGSSKLAHQWTALHFGDYVAYYLAIAYQIDPTPVEALTHLKDMLGNT